MIKYAVGPTSVGLVMDTVPFGTASVHIPRPEHDGMSVLVLGEV